VARPPSVDQVPKAPYLNVDEGEFCVEDAVTIVLLDSTVADPAKLDL
jgi:hypothetical protein